MTRSCHPTKPQAVAKAAAIGQATRKKRKVDYLHSPGLRYSSKHDVSQKHLQFNRLSVAAERVCKLEHVNEDVPFSWGSSPASVLPLKSGHAAW